MRKFNLSPNRNNHTLKKGLFFLILVFFYQVNIKATDRAEPYYMENYTQSSFSANAYFDGYTTHTINLCYNQTAPTLTIEDITHVGYIYGWYLGDHEELMSNCINDGLTLEDYLSNAGSTSYSAGALTEATRVTVFWINDQSEQYYMTMAISVWRELTCSINSEYETILYGLQPEIISVTSADGGGNITYQWQSSTNNSTWTNISGATSTTYQPSNATTSIYYRCKVSSNCKTLYTTSKFIEVYDDLGAGSITGTQTICKNTAPSMLSGSSATGCKGAYSYQWQSSTNNSTWTNISGATSTSYQPSELSSKTYYRRNVTDATCGTQYSNTVTITVREAVSFGSISSAQSICYGTTPSIITGTNASGGDNIFNYQWQHSTNNSSWTNISGATSINYQPDALTTSRYYRRLTTNTCESGYSNTIKITVSSDLVAGTISHNNNNICYNTAPSSITGTVANNGYGTYNYQWQSSSNNINWSNIPNEISQNHTPGKLTQTTYFRRKDTDDCREKYTNAVNIVVNNQFIVGTITGTQTICYNSEPEKIIGTEPTGGSENYSYQWQKASTSGSWSDIAGETYRDIEPSALTETTKYRRTDIDECNTLYTNAITITVLNKLESGTITGAQTVCYNTSPSILSGSNASGSDGNYSYQWQQSENGVNWSNIVNATNTYYQPSDLTETTYFRRSLSNTCGNLNSNIIETAVLEELDAGLISSSQLICYNTQPEQLIGNDATGGYENYTYQWQSSTDQENWSTIINANSIDYQPSDLTETTYYRRKVSDNCGEAYTPIITITVDAELTAGNVTGTQSICYGTIPTTINATIASGGSGDKYYQWQNSSNGESWNNIISATGVTYQPTSLTESTYFRRVDTDDCNTRNTNSILVTVDAELESGEITGEQFICYGATPSIITGTNANGGSGDIYYQWQKSTDGTYWSNISSANYVNYQPSALTQTTYFRRKVSDNCTEIISNEIIVSVYNEFIGGTIGSNQVVLYNVQPEILTSSISPTGGDGEYSYQWQKSTDQATWTNIPDATNENYQPSALTQTTYFRRKLASSCGEVTSNEVQITVTNDEIIIGTIEEDQFVCSGEIPEELISLNYDENLEIQWQKSSDGSTWTDIVGATDINYQPNLLTETTYYRKKVYTSSNGEVYTDPIIITVGSELDAGTIGSDQAACNNIAPEPITTTQAPNISEYSMIWESSTNGANWYEISDATESYYVVPILTETTYYRKKITTKCGDAYTNEVMIIVNDPLTGGTIEENQNVEYNNTPDLLSGTSATGGDGDYTYVWQKSINGVNWSDIPSSNSVNYQPDALTTTTRYRRQVTNGSCGEAYSNIVVIYVVSELIPGSIGNNQTICYNSIPDNIVGAAASGGIEVYTYYWEKSTDGESWTEMFGKNERILEHTQALTENTYFRRKVVSGESQAYSNIVTVELLDAVETPTVTYDESYCKGENVEIASNLDNILWYDASNNLISNNETLSFTAEASTTYYYQIQNTIGCLGDLKEIDILIDYPIVNIDVSAYDKESIENGSKVVFDPNIEYDFDKSTLSYEWTITHEDNGWYESMYDEEPEQYLHWEGWHDVSLKITTDIGCFYNYIEEDFLYVNAEKPDYSETKNSIGSMELDNNFGTETPLYYEIYPSPFSTDLTIKISDAKNDRLTIKVINLVGQIVFSSIVNGGESMKEHILNLSELRKGIYILVIQDGKNTYKQKVIKN